MLDQQDVDVPCLEKVSGERVYPGKLQWSLTVSLVFPLVNLCWSASKKAGGCEMLARA